MALPVLANTTCAIYRAGGAPPSAPTVSGVSCHLQADFARGHSTPIAASASEAWSWTHLLLVGPTVDVRDGYDQGNWSSSAPDSVYVPDQNGTPFQVLFVERVGRGTPHDHKRVYLDRKQPTWPTDQV